MAHLNPFRRRRTRRSTIVSMHTPLTDVERRDARHNLARERDLRLLAYALAALMLSLFLPELARFLESL